ncbi:MAG TPA: IcmT/TraK family protein [Alphaproteobacteria bacterium]|nr:IcmT/TraK family protein [Alphaproteobacteria bacterium]
MPTPVFSGDTHWRNSMKAARFGPLDARAAVPFVFALLHLRPWTLCLAAVTTFIFWFLEQRGISFEAALRGMRVWFVTRKRPNIQHSNRNRIVDYGFEPLPENMPPESLPKRGSSARPPQKRPANSAPRAQAPRQTIRPAPSRTAATRPPVKRD